jgi:glycosyltransferase involved in cell wall biosynthesis
MKVAIVHDWLTVYGGAERVLGQIFQLYPDADLFTLVDFLPQGSRGFIGRRLIQTSFLQELPFARTRYRSYLPLMPLAVEQFDLSPYDLVISSSYAVAKGVITGPDQLHVSYVHSPMRYAWDLQHEYLREAGLDRGLRGWLARWTLHKMRMWDVRTANGVDRFVANSGFVARRIRKAYRRNAEIVYPPVDIEAFSLRSDKEDFYVAASRMVPYKRVDLIIEAFARMPKRRLIVIGDGPDLSKLTRKAPANVTVLGYQPAEVLRDYMQRARALVFAAREDFGIAPVEAQACGTPVICFGKGGVLESIRGPESEQPTGVFFSEQSVEAIVAAVEHFERCGGTISAEACRENALRFSPERFREEFLQVVRDASKEFSVELTASFTQGSPLDGVS